MDVEDRDCVLLRKRNWIIVFLSEPDEESFCEAKCVMVVKGWISRMEDSVWCMWKWASGE